MKNKKYVPNCGSINTKKNGKKGHKQQYLCKSCLKQFVFKTRIHPNELWQEYTQGKQTYEQLAVKYHLSIRTIQRRLDKIWTSHINPAHPTNLSLSAYPPRPIYLIMDTTYFGKKLWFNGVYG